MLTGVLPRAAFRRRFKPSRTVYIALLLAAMGLFATSRPAPAGELMVTGAATYGGDFGLQVLLNDSLATYVQDESPGGEPRYRARFYVQPRLLEMAQGEDLDLFVAFDSSGQAQMKVILRHNAALDEKRLVVAALDQGTLVETSIGNETLLEGVWHSIEIDWRAADPFESNGHLTLWLDGHELPLTGLSNLDNESSRIDLVRWGVVEPVSAATGGNLLLDEFRSQREGFIGPVSVFDDTTPDFWGWPFIQAMYGSDLVDGCSFEPKLYCPKNKVTRAQIAKFVIASREDPGYTPPAATGTMFSDVLASYWAAPWIEQAVREGVMAGCGGSMFCPKDLVPRGEMARIVLTAREGVGYQPPPATGTAFEDVTVSTPNAAWIEQLFNEGAVDGCSFSPPRYCPDNFITRVQMAKFIVASYGIPGVPAVP